MFVAGGITDSLDGAIARLTDSKTEFGAILDPLADKLLLLSSFCVLAFMDRVPSWLTVLVIIRDVILMGGYFTLFVVSGERMAVRPSVIGKATTFFQLASVTVVLRRLRVAGRRSARAVPRALRRRRRRDHHLRAPVHGPRPHLAAATRRHHLTRRLWSPRSVVC